jgi:hypothetical protein
LVARVERRDVRYVVNKRSRDYERDKPTARTHALFQLAERGRLMQCEDAEVGIAAIRAITPFI